MRNTHPSPTGGAVCPDHRGGKFKWCPGHWGALPRQSFLNRHFRPVLCPDHRAPSRIYQAERSERGRFPRLIATAPRGAGRSAAP